MEKKKAVKYFHFKKDVWAVYIIFNYSVCFSIHSLIIIMESINQGLVV